MRIAVNYWSIAFLIIWVDTVSNALKRHASAIKKILEMANFDVHTNTYIWFSFTISIALDPYRFNF